MPGLIEVKVRAQKNGRQVASFKDTMGRGVRTSARMAEGGGGDWVRAEQLAWLANYGIELQQEQLDAGMGSDGQPMPPLKSSRRKRWSIKQQKWVEYGLVKPEYGYAGLKLRMGLKPQRDLYGLGARQMTITKRYSAKAVAKMRALGITGADGRDPSEVTWKKTLAVSGHMRDDIRINYLDDRQARISITTQASRIKALANERKAPWWGWGPTSMRKLQSAARGMFKQGLTEYLVEVGLMSASFMPQLAKRLNLRSLRRAA